MPQDGLAADFHHRLGFYARFLTESGSQTASEYDCFHSVPSTDSLIHGIDDVQCILNHKNQKV
jgi:hypothetical protein